MSRGLGALQREILALCPSVQGSGSPLEVRFYDATGHRYDGEVVIDVRGLKHRLIVQRGCWCTEECRAPQYRQPPWHTAHPKWWELGTGFDAAFSRALRTLIRRGVLVKVTRRHRRVPTVLDWPRRQRLYVVLGPEMPR
jgi:hypothetical protein